MDGFIKPRNSLYLLKNVQKPVNGVGFVPYGEGNHSMVSVVVDSVLLNLRTSQSFNQVSAHDRKQKEPIQIQEILPN